VFATDASYWQYYLGYKGVNISLSFTGGTGDLSILAEPQNCGTTTGMVNCSDYALVVIPRYSPLLPLCIHTMTFNPIAFTLEGTFYAIVLIPWD
jgi:hypothetical protein